MIKTGKQNITPINHLAASLAQHHNSLNGFVNHPLYRHRNEAMEYFTASSLPTPKDEEWKYTPLRFLEEYQFAPPGPGMHTIKTDITVPCSSMLVFQNGICTSPVQDDVFTDLLAQTHSPKLQKLLFGLYGCKSGFFAAMNAALPSNGSFIRFASGTETKEPLAVIHLAGGTKEPVLSQPRNLIIAEENSLGTVIELHSPGGDSPSFTNSVTEIYLGKNASLNYYKIVAGGSTAYHIGHTAVRQEIGSTFNAFSGTWGGKMSRSSLHTVLAGEQGHVRLNGLYLAGGDSHCGNHTTIEHAVPNCTSHELYRGILGGHSTGAFNGKVIVRQDAQKTNAYQANHNILLSADAAINAKPQLEIFADDVRCTHGATTGQLDKQELFYLRSRGIGPDQARNLLLHAFGTKTMEEVRQTPIREYLEKEFLQKLETGTG